MEKEVIIEGRCSRILGNRKYPAWLVKVGNKTVEIQFVRNIEPRNTVVKYRFHCYRVLDFFRCVRIAPLERDHVAKVVNKYLKGSSAKKRALIRRYKDKVIEAAIKGKANQPEKVITLLKAKKDEVNLYKKGMHPKQIMAAFEKWGEEAPKIIRKEPYKLLELRGVGFPTADRVARLMDSRTDDVIRAPKFKGYLKEQLNSRGDSLFSAEEFFAMRKLFEIRQDLMADNWLRVVNEDGRWYIPREWFEKEKFIAEWIAKAALDKKLTILTGGPGTGKTYMLRGLIPEKCTILTPTGKAAMRIKEVGHERAKTIHRWIGWPPRPDEKKKLKHVQLLGIDEGSMVDTEVLYHLLKTLDYNALRRLIISGDHNQLPSVGRGQVLYDLVQWLPKQNIIRLTKAHRFVSTIGEKCKEVSKGRVPRWNQDLEFISAETAEDFVEAMSKLGQKQIISPRATISIFGTHKLNPKLRKLWQKTAEAFTPGEPVIQTKNDYDLKVFNGEIGVVANKSPGGIIVRFPGSEIIEYPTNYKHLAPAYVITVHKSQGSEWDEVVVAVEPKMGAFLNRNLIYTAMSRAKKKCWVVGSKASWQLAIERPGRRRKLALGGLLARALYGKKGSRITAEEIVPEEELFV